MAHEHPEKGARHLPDPAGAKGTEEHVPARGLRCRETAPRRSFPAVTSAQTVRAPQGCRGQKRQRSAPEVCSRDPSSEIKEAAGPLALRRLWEGLPASGGPAGSRPVATLLRPRLSTQRLVCVSVLPQGRRSDWTPLGHVCRDSISNKVTSAGPGGEGARHIWRDTVRPVTQADKRRKLGKLGTSALRRRNLASPSAVASRVWRVVTCARAQPIAESRQLSARRRIPCVPVSPPPPRPPTECAVSPGESVPFGVCSNPLTDGRLSKSEALRARAFPHSPVRAMPPK